MAEKQAINEYRWHTHGNGVWHKKKRPEVKINYTPGIMSKPTEPRFGDSNRWRETYKLRPVRERETMPSNDKQIHEAFVKVLMETLKDMNRKIVIDPIEPLREMRQCQA